MPNTKNPHAQFGSFNTETGESQTGYIDKNGEMKFKKLPWYKHLFQKAPVSTKYLGTNVLAQSYLGIFGKCCIRVPVYMEWNPFTETVYDIYSTHKGHVVHYNIDVYLHDKSLIIK
jgi:hypothetical protein